MSSIIESVVSENEYAGMTKINLKSLWNSPEKLDSNTYNVYKNMRAWLKSSGVQHRFMWNNTGQYLPDSIYVDANSDTATYFMLRYGTCK